MDSLLTTIEQQAESALKPASEDWLNIPKNQLEKAFPYLTPTLLGLLSAQLRDRKSVKDLLEFFKETRVNPQWADNPNGLFDRWKQKDSQLIDRFRRMKAYILGDHGELIFEQLSSIGDLDEEQLEKILPFIAALIFANLAKQVEKDGDSVKKVSVLLRDEEENIKIHTPSKLQEQLARTYAEIERPPLPEEDEDEKPQKEPLPFPPRLHLILYSLALLVLIVLLYWIKSPEMDALGPMIRWESSETKETGVDEQRLWKLKGGTYISLYESDPLNDYVEWSTGAGADSLRKFRLKKVAWPDTVLPDYYHQTAQHLSTLHKIKPEQWYLLRVTVHKAPGAELPAGKVKTLRNEIKRKMTFTDTSTHHSVVINVARPEKPLLSETSTPQMQWTIVPVDR